jgi:MFS family permease
MRIIQFPDINRADYTPVSISESNGSNQTRPKSQRSLYAIVCQRTFLVAAFGGFVSWSSMAVQMSAIPLAMNGVGYSFAQATTVIEYHLLGMFAPSFFTGILCDWFGSRAVLFIGFIIHLSGALLFQLGFEIAYFTFGAIIIGIGWNLGYVGASTMLTEAHNAEEKAKTHSAYEGIVMTSISISFFSSGFVAKYFGWKVLTSRIIALYLASAILILTIDTIIGSYQRRKKKQNVDLES